MEASGDFRSNDSPRDEAREMPRVVAGKLRQISSIVDREMKAHPWRLVGVFGALAFGVGVLSGSRLSRSILAAVGSYAVSEVLRAQVQHYIAQMERPAEKPN
jgi:hypothetical protein